MRLTHLKLAGFKSFVDKTTVSLHGQRVGIVGPNGCGKSNVMESVRWVLGESSAKEMRANAMDAVIFNGSANRNSVSRASVELVFDNSLGGANGQWSRYTEISVKRVIEREKGSTYYINNIAARRRDVADLFLGTGLGGHGYAIIGQNTISRIVEAKPEELRVFLEEAAGISKYKERRRETELRLRDTRENLTRVEDICRELQKQISKLESQAAIAEQYYKLEASLKTAEGQLWILKKYDASRDWETKKTRVKKLINQLEQKTAKLRKNESNLEISRQAFYQSNEAINLAQAAFYEANAEVTNLENQVKQNAEARERIAKQLSQINNDLEQNQATDIASQKKLTEINAKLAIAENTEKKMRANLETLKIKLPAKETVLRLAQEKEELSQKNLYEANQRMHIVNNDIQYLQQSVTETHQRLQQLKANLADLVFTDDALMKKTKSTVNDRQSEVTKLDVALKKSRSDEQLLQVKHVNLQEQQNQAERAVSQASAEIASLLKIQKSLNASPQLSSWLSSVGLNNHQRLWQKIKADDKWSVALEVVLGEKLNAIITTESQLNSRPPHALILGFGGKKAKKIQKNTKLTPLIKVIKACPSELTVMLEEWLANTYLLHSNEKLSEVIEQLEIGERLVNQAGDIFDRHSVSYHGEDSGLHGVIERQQRLESLQIALPTLNQSLDESNEALKLATSQLHALKAQHQQQAQALKTATQSLHEQQLALFKLQQSQEAALQREKTIKVEIKATKERQAQLLADTLAKETAAQSVSSNISALEKINAADKSLKLNAQEECQALRDAIAEANSGHQESAFNLKIINNNIAELKDKSNVINKERQSLLRRQKETQNTLSLAPTKSLKHNLSAAISAKQLKEDALAKARHKAADQESKLQEMDQARLQKEQQLNVARDELASSRLAEQEARLHFEQCQAHLNENKMDEEELSKSLTEDIKINALSEKIKQLQQKISSLGAVNLAAIDELNSESERKQYLDSQMQDLQQASETLASAISKIDKETRDTLIETFNVANTHFGELFTTLFGGGKAKLELIGGEVLDAGLQVFAQPLGKKNSTIQLLSGGEKALTALALVFALFKLNPAPFCLMDEVDAPLDDSNTERFCTIVKQMSENTQFLFVSHNKITMEIAQQLIGVTMQEPGVSKIVDVDMEVALQMQA